MASEQPSEQQILNKFHAMRESANSMAETMATMESDLHEHEIVLKALEPMDGDRKCFRLIGGVLVERTVREVIPAVQTNKDNLKQTVGLYQQQLKTKTKELTDFAVKYNIGPARQAPQQGSKSAEGTSGSTPGVLVSSR